MTIQTQQPDQALSIRPTNWAGNLTFGTDQILYPKNIEEVRQLVKTFHYIKPLGSRHCFNDIADSDHALLSMSGMEQVIAIDKQNVTVEAGIKYGTLSPLLHQKGLALHNLASLPHISVAGSCATATHGSGVGNGNLATALTGLELVTGGGEVISLSRRQDGEQFRAVAVGLGAIGVVTKVTLRVEPTFEVSQHVFLDLPFDQLAQHFTAIISSGYSVSLFTRWTSDVIDEVWIKRRLDHPNQAAGTDSFYGATAATQHMHPIAGADAEHCTGQLGVAGPWFERLPHFKMGFTPSNGVELQSEYFVPAQHAVEAILAIKKLGHQISPHLLVSEIRAIAADDLWMSPCYRQPCIALHFTWKQQWDAVSQLLPVIERELAPFQPRPHWGKLFTMPPDLISQRYERFDDFRNLVRQYDPNGKFLNSFLRRNLQLG